MFSNNITRCSCSSRPPSLYFIQFGKLHHYYERAMATVGHKQLNVFHFLIGAYSAWVVRELIIPPGVLDRCCLQGPVAATAVFSNLPNGRFPSVMYAPGISEHSTLLARFQAEHNILMHPFHQPALRVYLEALFSTCTAITSKMVRV